MSELLNEVRSFTIDERVTSTSFRKKTARVNPMTQKDIERMINDRKYKGNTSALMKAVQKKFPDEYESDIVQDMLRKHAETNEGFASDAQRRAAFASGYKEKGKKKKEELEKIKGKTPADDGRRAAVKDDIKDAEKKGDKKLVAKLKETTTILDRIDNKLKERRNG